MWTPRLGSVARAAAGAVWLLAASGVASAPARAASPPLRLQVDKSKVDLKKHRLEVQVSRPVVRLKVTVVGESGATLADQEQEVGGRAGALVVTWTPSSDEAVATVDVRATDATGAWSNVRISPWFVAIPHEDVNFKTDAATIEDGETPKLDAAFAKLGEVLAQDAAHGRQHPGLALFIAGHTDTVGNAAYNLKLSQARARAIAAWFRARGVRLPLAYEGFGETSPAVKTADNVDEPRNRRVDYVLSDDPPIYAAGFKPAWKRIP
jgi:outer membrane protein OmpA-like peptidoglycan-associated protein